MTAEFDVREWDFLPPLDVAALPDSPPAELVLIEWTEPCTPSAPAVIFADQADVPSDVAEALRHGTAWRQPGSAEMARLASLNFSALDAAGRIAALADQQRQAAWWSAR